jgi:hypothetical protein
MKYFFMEEGAANKGEVGTGCLSSTGLVASENDLFVKGIDIRCMTPFMFTVQKVAYVHAHSFNSKRYELFEA